MSPPQHLQFRTHVTLNCVPSSSRLLLRGTAALLSNRMDCLLCASDDSAMHVSLPASIDDDGGDVLAFVGFGRAEEEEEEEEEDQCSPRSPHNVIDR